VWLQLPGTAIGSAIAAVLLEDMRLDWSLSLAGALLFLAIMSTAVALVWQFRAQRHMSSARASLIFCFEPVFAAVTSWLFWGEEFSLSQGVGAAMILAGMILAVLGEARGERVPVTG
jgi:drug/metabolite transporter (DMT)-like permease